MALAARLSSLAAAVARVLPAAPAAAAGAVVAARRVAPAEAALHALVRSHFATKAAKAGGAAGSKASGSGGAAKPGAHGDEYILPAGAKEAFERDGFVVLRGFLTEAEVAPLEVIYDRFMRAEIKVPGADFCDMSATSGMKDMPLSEFQIVNAMLPRKYYPPLVGNIYERRSASVARQLFPGTAMDIDYDQLLDKRPNKPGAIFAWHQDMAYWPPPAYTPDTRTATFSLAVDATNEKNGALKFIPGSHVAKVIRPHVPVGATRDDAHAVAIKVDESKEPIVMAKLARGDVSVHNEYVVHGSAGNLSDGHRRTYVIAYRTAATIALERKAGFTHSHNDKTNWDTFNEWQKGAAPKA